MALGDELPRLREIVVTHFDADHWAGLRALVDRLAPGDLPPRVKLIHPRTPERSLDPGIRRLALETTFTGTGVRSLDLRLALERVTSPIVCPVAEGDAFRAASREWSVLWPPRHLSPRLRRGLVDAVERMERLADEMEEADLPELRNNLDLAREIGFSARTADGDRFEEAAGDRDAYIEEDFRHGDDGDDADDQAGPIHGEPLDLGRIPPAFHDRLRAASRAVAAANNDLSLVFHDADRRFLIAFGDIGGSALRTVLEATHDRYEIVLPPHHGTRPVPPGFPLAGACISQAGTQHLSRWRRHVDSHGNPTHLPDDGTDRHRQPLVEPAKRLPNGTAHRAQPSLLHARRSAPKSDGPSAEHRSPPGRHRSRALLAARHGTGDRDPDIGHRGAICRCGSHRPGASAR